MKTRISLVSMVTLLTFIITPSTQAFTLELPLEDQIALYNQTELNDSNALTLANTGSRVETASFSPDLRDDHIIFAGTSVGTYFNGTYEPSFYQDINMPEVMKQNAFSVEFGSTYKDDGTAVAYNEDNVIISFSKGSTWSEVDLQTEETIQAAWPGPAYDQNPYVYFLTSSGLYRQSMNNNATEQVIASDSAGDVVDFSFSPTTTQDNIFYVAKGTKVLKTENFGTSWIEYDTGLELKKLINVDNGSDSGETVFLAGNKTVEKAGTLYDFFPLSLPSEVTEVYDIENVQNGDEQDFVINTDAGVYTTFNDGNNWSKVEYEMVSDSSDIKDLFAVQEGVDYSIFFLYDGVLYKDFAAAGQPEPYMDGIDVANVFSAEGSAESHNLLDLSEDTFPSNYVVDEAILVADVDAMEQTLTFFMTADGENWEEVTPNESHTFENQGNDLRWRAELATTDTQVSPVISGINVEFGMIEGEEPAPEDGLCEGFTDVQAQDPLCPALSYVKEQGIFEGYPDGTFQPSQAINRAETVKVIVEGFNVPQLADPGTNLGFSDVIIGEWYMPYLATAQAEGIIEGYPDGTFKPEQTVNYVELIKIFFETAEVALTPAAGGTQWYQTYLNYAMNNDYLVYQMLDAGMKRGDVATLFYQHSMK